MHKLRQARLLLLTPLLLPLMALPAAAATTVAVTLPPLAGIVTMLDKSVQITCLLPAAADPHHFQLQPRKIEALNSSDLLLRTSYDDGGWPLPPAHTNTLDLWPERDHGWLSPTAVRMVMPRIADALITLQPDQKEHILYNLKESLKIIESVEESWNSAMHPLRASGVIMQHPAWQRLMSEMSIPVLAVLESGHHGHEHAPHLLDEALAALNKQPDALLLYDIAHINRSLTWLAAHARKQPRQVHLNAMGSCHSSWRQLMDSNLSNIKHALNP